MLTKLITAVLLLTIMAASQEEMPALPFDIEGIRLGMPVREAMAALRAHNAHLRLVPDSAQYPGIPSALTYGISAVGAGEGFYFLVTMPPNEVVISRITRVAHFTGETIPRQDALAASLIRRYGPVSWDTGPAALTIGTRDLYWIQDRHGTRIKAQPPPRCLGQSTFFMNGPVPGNPRRWDPLNVRLPPLAARLRIEQGFVNREDPIANQCSEVSMVHARLFRASLMGVSVPNLVEYLVLLMASGPLDRKATEATHDYWLKRKTK